MITNTVVSAKNFVRRNERKILITTAAVTTTAAVIMKIAVNQHNEFLKEHNLFDEYYTTDEE